MSEARDFSKVGFVKSVVLPATWVFLLPLFGLAFFLHAEARFDTDAREALLNDIRSDRTMNEEARAEAIKIAKEVPFSTMIKNPAFAASVDPDIRFYYTQFRWLIRISLFCIASGVLVFGLGLLCVMLSFRSQQAQYRFLRLGWNVLRIFGAVQVVLQGLLLLALSYWVTALWMNIYIPKLIFVVGLVVIGAVFAVLVAIFRRVQQDFEVEGEVIDEQSNPALWHDLKQVCERVGTQPPDQVIVGVDDNFFATETPVKVAQKIRRGRSLFASLSLLKELNSDEAEAVLAHEMAHFSGQDTMFTTKTSPLLQRFDMYLEGLHNGFVSIPIFYFMLCFRSLFELSLGKVNREREFRADQVAAEMTSPDAIAGALWKITAYSKYRNSVEEKLFGQETVLEEANIYQQIESGFGRFARGFADDGKPDDLIVQHPFDSHPPLQKRLESIGVDPSNDTAFRFLAEKGDGGWYRKIVGAEEIEKGMWQDYEQRFREFHENTLPFRFLPANEQEREVVERSFPPIQIESKKKGVLSLNCVELAMPEVFDFPVPWQEITKMEMHDSVLFIHTDKPGYKKLKLKMTFFKNQQQALDAIGNYYGRAMAAKQYRAEKAMSPTQLR